MKEAHSPSAIRLDLDVPLRCHGGNPATSRNCRTPRPDLGPWLLCGNLLATDGREPGRFHLRSSGRRYRDGGGRWGDGPAIRQQRPGIIKQHDPVAQQAPPLLRMTGHGPGGHAIRRLGIRALRMMLARLIPQRPRGSRWREQDPHGSSYRSEDALPHGRYRLSRSRVKGRCPNPRQRSHRAATAPSRRPPSGQCSPDVRRGRAAPTDPLNVRAAARWSAAAPISKPSCGHGLPGKRGRRRSCSGSATATYAPTGPEPPGDLRP